MVVVPTPLHEGGQYHTMMGQVSLGIEFGASGTGSRQPAWEWQDRDDCGMVQALQGKIEAEVQVEGPAER